MYTEFYLSAISNFKYLSVLFALAKIKQNGQGGYRFRKFIALETMKK